MIQNAGIAAGAGAVVLGFRDALTRAVFAGRCPKGFPADLFTATRRKLIALNAAASLDDLKD